MSVYLSLAALLALLGLYGASWVLRNRALARRRDGTRLQEPGDGDGE